MDEQLNAAQARDHIEMVARILQESQQRLCAGGEFFLVWGLFSGLITVLIHLANARLVPLSTLWLLVPAFAGCVAFSLLRGAHYRRVADRRSLLEREFFNVLWLTIGLAFLADVAAYNIFVDLAGAAIWSFSEAIVLFYIGLHGNRRAVLCGITVVVSLVAANFIAYDVRAYVLAAGMVAGYGGFGLAELLVRE